MAADGNRDLESQDVVLGFEVGGGEGVDFGESGEMVWRKCGEEGV